MTGLFVSFGIFCVLLFLYMLSQAFQNVLSEKTIKFNDFPKEVTQLKIFFITDIHRRKVSTEIVNKVINRVDLVIIGGDLTEKGVPFERVEKNIQKLIRIAPIYFVWGNNDHEVDHQKFVTLLEKYDVRILENDSVKLTKGITLAGIDDVSLERDSLEDALSSEAEDQFTILLSHNPSIVQQMNNTHNVPLVLSGHTHGGQIRILGWGLYKKGGIEEFPYTTLVVSNGYGTTALPLRLGARAETHLLTLTRK
ncbi:putative MPP superfamily phosphohydrolase [Bacillus pakistanensis]|uniref:MPP superfamily phosphohydrolase n=1 Tax=Rossellomorea pakistanensis TaxID=992288 RepID=A0ABS2N960_9BACI|nr:metallophosphoesterase [Bacillus pakistanensis]MBM7584378.1 putative MPP superfamily phosphohydrolase [Bacillus pakistanensis]